MSKSEELCLMLCVKYAVKQHLSLQQASSLPRTAPLCACSGATSTCPSTASCPPSPYWACSWPGPSCSSTSRTAITGQRSASALEWRERKRRWGLDKGRPLKVKQINVHRGGRVNEGRGGLGRTTGGTEKGSGEIELC